VAVIAALCLPETRGRNLNLHPRRKWPVLL
jgi:hypothetical protein